MEQLPENELIALVKTGDHHAYEQLFNLHWKRALSIAYRKCGDEDEALDIVQNIFSQIWENREKLSISGSFSAWITAVVKYKVIDFYRTSQAREEQKRLLLQQLEAQQASVIKEPGSIILRQLQQDWQAAVEGLPVRMREVYLLSQQSGLSIAEISRKLSLNQQSVKNHLFRAKERLRKMLDHHFLFL